MGVNTASANTGALSAAAGHYASVSKGCFACHADGNGQKNAVTAAWLSAGGTSQSAPTNWTQFDTADSDGDGVNNQTEIERGTAPYTNPNASASASSGGGGGCIASSATTPLMMLLTMLSLGFFVRRKKD
jgi:hypothetical protein